QIVGQQQKIPLTGTIAVDAHVAGTLANLNGGGHVSLVDGVVYGEPYESAVADLTVQGKDIEAKSVLVKLHGMQLGGNGGYDMGTDRVHGHAEGKDITLSKFTTVQQAKMGVDGVASVVADANGTLAEP